MPNIRTFFNVRNMIKRLLPPFLREPRLIAWLFALCAPIRYIKVEFDVLKMQQDYDLQFNSQTLSLETRLNQRYGLVQGSIYIVTQAIISNSIYIFWLNENQNPTYIFWLSENHTPQYVYWISEYNGTTSVDFLVYVPHTLIFDINELKAIINLYKLAGKRYSIVLY